MTFRILTVTMLGIAASALAQGPLPPTADGTAIVRGRIVAADTGKPLRRARVSFASLDSPGRPQSITTNVDGRYEMKNLAAGRYAVSADRSGYLMLRYGQRRPLETARPLQVLDGQTLENVDFSLPRTGVIAGQVVDEVGDALAGATVFALRPEYWQGRRQLVPSGPPIRTDDAGRYRVTGLSPGTYLVRALTRETWTVTRGGTKDVMAFAPTYFPGTADVNVARRVTVGVGQQITGVDVSMLPARTVSVSGTAVDSRGRPLPNIMLVQSAGGPNGGMTGSGGRSVVAGDGTFAIHDVAPGEYTLLAAGSDEVARRPIVVAGADVDHVSLVGAGGWSATGLVRTESGAPPPIRPDRVRISANPVEGFGAMRMQGEPVYRQMLNDDWTFSIGGVAGPARFRVGLPDGWAVHSILYQGRDLVDAIIEPKRTDEPMAGVEIVVTDRVTTLTGQLVDKQGAPLDGTVIVFSSDREKWRGDSRWTRAARPDQTGQFQIKGLPAGEYLAVAADFVQDGAWNDPDFLGPISRNASRFTLVAGESRTIAVALETR